MPARRSLPAALLAALAATPLAAQEKSLEWPQFRGPTGQGVSTAKGLPTTWGQNQNLVWKAEPGAGSSSPTLVGGKIYLTSYSGYGVPGQPRGRMDDLKRHLVCLDPKDGTVVWKKDVPSKLPEEPRTRDDHGYASSTLAADGERLYAFFGKSGVFAFSHDGEQLWNADVGSGLRDWGSAASPVLHGDLVIVNASVESKSLVGLDKKTGKEVWRARGIDESWNTPILVPVKGGKTELVVAMMGKVLGIDPETGERLWSCDTGIRWYMVPGMVAADGVVYCVGGRNDQGLAVKAGGRGDVTRTHRLWTMSAGSNVSSLILHEGHLYWMKDSTGTACCADARTGEIVYQQDPSRGAQVYASPLLAEGRIYYTARDGRTFVVAARPKFELLATNDLRDRSLFHASPVPGEGRLYIRSDKYLYCVGK